MLETPEERVRLLKAGYTGKEIEKLYIKSNNLRIVHFPFYVILNEINIAGNDHSYINSEQKIEVS